MKPKIFICSPYRCNEFHTLEDNVALTKKVCRWALLNNYVPFAPHLIYPQCLNDNKQRERDAGISAGFEWLSSCDELWQIGSHITEGMQKEIDYANKINLPIKVFKNTSIFE